MTTTSAKDLLVAADPTRTYFINEYLSYRFGTLTRASTCEITYCVQVHYGDDGAGMRLKKNFDGDDLPFLVDDAIAFVRGLA